MEEVALFSQKGVVGINAQENLNLSVEESTILDADATTLGEMIRKQEVTSTKAIKIYIEHIKKMNPTINFLVEDRFSVALAEAENVDCQILNNQAFGALFGVPMSMKESFYRIEGMKTTGGLIHRKDAIQPMDAEVVQKLKKLERSKKFGEDFVVEKLQ